MAKTTRPTPVIFACVVCVHLLLIWAVSLRPHTPQKPMRRQLRVQTLSLKPQSPPKQKESTASIAPEKKAVVASPPVSSNSKKPALKKATAKKKVQATGKKEESPRQRELLDAVTQSLNAISSAELTPQHSFTAPKPIISLNTETSALASSSSFYEEYVASIVQEHLRLPEYGEVQLRLILSQVGEVIAITILQAKSAKNAAYVEKKLKSLRFPPLDADVKESQYSIQLTVCNES